MPKDGDSDDSISKVFDIENNLDQNDPLKRRHTVDNQVSMLKMYQHANGISLGAAPNKSRKATVGAGGTELHSHAVDSSSTMIQNIKDIRAP